MVVANVFFILLVMVPSFYQYVILGGTTGGIVARLMLIHGVLGVVAQVAGIYLVLRMRTGLIPRRFRVRDFRLMMRCTLALWTGIFVLGIGIYYYRYLQAEPVTTFAASLEHFRQAGGDLVRQSGELRGAAERRDAPGARAAAERLVNLIEGRTGTAYGDLDKNGSVEDPGDGIGLLSYLRVLTNAAPEGPVASLAETVGGWLKMIRNDALAVIAAADVDAVERKIENVVTLAGRAEREGIAELAANAPPVVIIVMDEFVFKPKQVTITKGTAVVWINQEGETHTATADDKRFDSGDLPAGGIFAFTVTEAGTIPYYCDYHGGRGGVDMAGALVVE
jgi:plastocyanin